MSDVRFWRPFERLENAYDAKHVKRKTPVPIIPILSNSLLGEMNGNERMSVNG